MNNIIPDDDVMNRIVKMMAIAMRIPKVKKLIINFDNLKMNLGS